ncbi:hypothetical protein [Halosolutus gelatinilyticus]|nr:hypothetical protein [Halosolutus gelatinilyticus]
MIASALLLLFVVWRVYRARQQQPVDLEEDDETSPAVDRDEVPMIE